MRREAPARAALGALVDRGWRPARAVQGVVLAVALGGAAVLESLTGRGVFRPALALVGLVLVAAGLALHVRARRALGALWSGVVEVRAGHRVVRSGPYATVRHPIYLAVVLLAWGSCLVHASLATLCLAAGVTAGLLVKVRVEERALRAALGVEYARYADVVPALVPDAGPALAALGRVVTPARRRYALYLGALLWAGWLVTLARGPGFLDLAGEVKGTDFLEFYAAGRIVADGDVAELYDLEHQRQVEHAITAPQDWPGLHGFLNPPFFALPFVPLAHLPYLVAFACWTALALGLLAVALALVDRPARALPWALAFVPVFAAVSYGQNSLLSLAILTATYVLLRRGRDGAAGAVLGALLYKPQLVAVLVLALAADRRWRALAGVATTGALLAAVSWAVSPAATRGWLALSRAFPTMLADPGFPTWNMHSLYSFAFLLLPDRPRVAQAIGVLASAAVLLVARRLQPRYAPETLAHWFAVALWATALASPHVFLYDLSILVLAGLLLRPAVDEARWLGACALLWPALVFSGPLARLELATFGAAVQLSVPVILVVGWGLLRDPGGRRLSEDAARRPA